MAAEKIKPRANGTQDFGDWRVGAAVTQIAQLKVGQQLLSDSKQFEAMNLCEVTKVDEERGIAYAKFIDPLNPQELRSGANADGFAIWEGDLQSKATSYSFAQPPEGERFANAVPEDGVVEASTRSSTHPEEMKMSNYIDQGGHTDSTAPIMVQEDHWYHHRHDLESELVFLTAKGLVKLDRRVPGDGTQWYVADWDKGWSFYDSTIEPGDLLSTPIENVPQAIEAAWKGYQQQSSQIAANADIQVKVSKCTEQPVSVIAARIAEALPANSGYEKGYRDALESMALALGPKLASTLDDAITTALDAYANNAEETDAVTLNLNVFDDVGDLVDETTANLSVAQLSDIVDHASQLILIRRDGQSLDNVLDELDEALSVADVIDAAVESTDRPRG